MTKLPRRGMRLVVERRTDDGNIKPAINESPGKLVVARPSGKARMVGVVVDDPDVHGTGCPRGPTVLTLPSISPVRRTLLLPGFPLI